MTDPFFLETLVVRGLLPFEEPFVIAHEWSHLAGFTDEGEANFVGWLTCLRASDAAKYSGWLFLYSQAIASLPASERAAVDGPPRSGPAARSRAIAERVRREVRPPCVGGRLARLRPVSQGQPRRSRHGELRGGVRLVLGVAISRLVLTGAAGWRAVSSSRRGSPGY